VKHVVPGLVHIAFLRTIHNNKFREEPIAYFPEGIDVGGTEEKGYKV
jgi:hypothetical protein